MAKVKQAGKEAVDRQVSQQRVRDRDQARRKRGREDEGESESRMDGYIYIKKKKKHPQLQAKSQGQARSRSGRISHAPIYSGLASERTLMLNLCLFSSPFFFIFYFFIFLLIDIHIYLSFPISQLYFSCLACVLGSGSCSGVPWSSLLFALSLLLRPFSFCQ